MSSRLSKTDFWRGSSFDAIFFFCTLQGKQGHRGISSPVPGATEELIPSIAFYGQTAVLCPGKFGIEPITTTDWFRPTPLLHSSGCGRLKLVHSVYPQVMGTRICYSNGRSNVRIFRGPWFESVEVQHSFFVSHW